MKFEGCYKKGRPDLTDEDYRQKIKAKVKESERGCWEWQGFCHPKGYGETSYRGKNWRLHRLVYVLWRGPIPEGWDVCHTCDNPPCVNPLHLFAAPRVANLIDMRNKGRNRQTQKTHCPQGHSYAEHGVPHASRPTWRRCSVCEREKQFKPEYIAWRREYQRKRREAKRAQRAASLALTQKGDSNG